ncbi:hypothetical protein ACP70R_020332 [Stipagrostis hirtigluma subsp. patula]
MAARLLSFHRVLVKQPCRCLLLLFLLVAVFPQRSTCRPLHFSKGNNAVVKAASNAMAVPAEQNAAAAAANRHGHLWLLDMKPRGKPPPSAPSKGTN